MKHLAILLALTVVISCKDDNPDNNPANPNPPLTDTTTILGYSILQHLPGIWNGPVTSSTPLGSYPEWIVDFRPIAAAHVSGKAELDTVNDIFMSIFLTRFEGSYQMGFRNGGGFAGEQRVSYARLDSVREDASEAYYRFSDFQAGERRVYSEFTFKGDSLIMRVYTNKYNTITTPTIHMEWRARRLDSTSTQEAIDAHNYPSKVLARDLDTAFTGLSEAVYYSLTTDPFPQSEHPYLGETTVNLSLASNVQTNASGTTTIIITTQPLFNGVLFQADNLRYRSRYLLLKGSGPFSYTFDYMHPGTYYLNAIYDANSNLQPNTDEYIAFPFDAVFSLPVEGQATENVTINFKIP